MDNIIIEKIWCDKDFFEIKIIANNEFITVYQECYTQESKLKKNAEAILQYLTNSEKECYVEYGKKTGNYTPAFSMKLLPADYHGHIKIEMDIEIADNLNRSHRCMFYIESEIGLVEQFANNMLVLAKSELGYRISLLEP